MAAWNRILYVLAFLLAGGSAAAQHLVLVGGGEKPPEALSRFMRWAGGHEARILFINWATVDSAGGLAQMRSDLAPYQPGSLEASPAADEMHVKRSFFLQQLQGATGVFFCGGDQNRIMDVISDESLASSLRRRYDEGVVFGGTSAGTAVMAQTMFTGSGDLSVVDASAVGSRDGLGLLPDIVIDMHFFKRRRENRLFSMLLKTKDSLAMGIDEGTAVSVEDNRFARVEGPGDVFFVEGDVETRKFQVQLLLPQETFDLARHRRVNRK